MGKDWLNLIFQYTSVSITQYHTCVCTYTYTHTYMHTYPHVCTYTHTILYELHEFNLFTHQSYVPAVPFELI